MRVRRTHRPHHRRRAYATQPVRTVVTRPEAPTVPWQRARSHSDEGPGLHREYRPQERPVRIYTDKEIAMASGHVPGSQVEGAKPRVFSTENIGTAQMGQRPATAHINQAGNDNYDRGLEGNLVSADKEEWNRRPGTPY